MSTELGAAEATPAEMVHLLRRQLKRLRAVLRLVRGSLASFDAENATFRDIGRRLAPSRDAEVLWQTCTDLAARIGLGLGPEIEADLLRAAGLAHRPADDAPQSMPGIAAELERARQRLDDWQIDGDGFAVLGEGLQRVYAAMRKSARRARRAPTPAHFHEWRKQARYLSDQLSVLEPMAPDIVKGYRKAAAHVARALGAHHDLDVLAAALPRTVELALPDRDRLLAAIATRNAALESEAFSLEGGLGADSPSQFRQCFARIWKHWKPDPA